MAPRTRNVSFDAMVKFFLQYYNIPTRKDVDKIINRLEKIEKMVQAKKLRTPAAGFLPGQPRLTASNTVLDVIREYKEGAGFAEIQEKTGFDDKKIRNIIFRLDKIGKIKRVSRGVYIAL